MEVEAPDNIYLFKKPNDVILGTWFLDSNEEFENIEYTRTDAFIEKACDAYCKVCGHYAHSVPTHICRHDCQYFSDFKRRMKEE